MTKKISCRSSSKKNSALNAFFHYQPNYYYHKLHYTIKIQRQTGSILVSNGEIMTYRLVVLLFIVLELISGEGKAGTNKTVDTTKTVNVILSSALSELNDFRPGFIYLEVKNLSDSLLTFDRIEIAEYPSFIRIKPSSLDTITVSRKTRTLFYPGKQQIPSRTSQIYTVYVESADQVQPGKHRLLFNIFFHRNNHGKPQAESITIGHDLQVKVFGENEIMGALSNAVTFLIFPGLIMIIIFSLVWKSLTPGPEKEKFPEFLNGDKITDLRFWVVAITLSLVMVWKGYSLMTVAFTSFGHRDYLYGYGFKDIVCMWFFSVAIGTISALLTAGILYCFKKVILWKKRYEAKNAFHESDIPMMVLKKMLDRGFNEARLSEITVKSTKEKGFIIESDLSDPEKKAVWIIGRIHVACQEDAQNLVTTLQAHIADPKSTLDLIVSDFKDGLKEENTNKKRGIEEIKWENMPGYVVRPKYVEKTDLENEIPSRFIFSVHM